MPRPQSRRKISAELRDRVYKPRGVPADEIETVELTLDGLEAIRLADHAGLYHEEAAERMGVSRATFGRILGEARRILADALVNGKAIALGGGVVDERPARTPPCPVHGRGKRMGRWCRCGPPSEGNGPGRPGSRRAGGE